MLSVSLTIFPVHKDNIFIHSIVYTHSVFHFPTLLLSCSISHPQLHILYFSSSVSFCLTVFCMSPPISLSVNFFQSFFPYFCKAFYLFCRLSSSSSLSLSTTCQFLRGGGLFGDRWRSLIFGLAGEQDIVTWHAVGQIKIVCPLLALQRQRRDPASQCSGIKGASSWHVSEGSSTCLHTQLLSYLPAYLSIHT